MKILTLIFLVGFVSCSSQHFKKRFPAKHSLVDLTQIKQEQKLTPSISKRGKQLKKKGYKLFKRKEGFFAEKGRTKLLLIDGYQCTKY